MRGAGGGGRLTESYSQRFAESRSEVTFIIVAGLAGVPLAMTLFLRLPIEALRNQFVINPIPGRRADAREAPVDEREPTGSLLFF
jgi:hypothetical protein